MEYTYTKLLDQIGSDESLLETLEAMLLKKDSFSLIIGEDCIRHPNATKIAVLAGFVEKYTAFKVLVIPTQTNTLGVCALCDLDEVSTGKTVGYNVPADFELSALGDGDIDMAPLSQQEGTFVNIDKNVVQTNAAIQYDGYVLNDIANEILDHQAQYTIDYTQEIFKRVKFDDLENHFTNDRVEHRGYPLDIEDTVEEKVDYDDEKISLEVAENEYVIYDGNPIDQFNDFTKKARLLQKDTVAFFVSEATLAKLNAELEINENEKIEITTNDISVILELKVDKDLVGEISYVPTFDKSINTKALFENRFEKANLRKV